MSSAILKLATRIGLRIILFVGVYCAISESANYQVRGDEIVLRNLSKLTDVTVTSLDEDGIKLANGSHYGLDSVLSATVSDQARFDQLNQDIGLDLFRLRVRLQRKDIENLQPHLNKLYPVFADRSSSSALIVQVARFKDAVLAGRWGVAIESHFRIVAFVQNEDPEKKLAYQRILSALHFHFDSATGLSPVICPFGFDDEEIVANWEQILAAYRALPQAHPTGLDLYFFLLAQSTKTNLDAKDSTNRIKLTFLEKLLLQTLLTATNPKSEVAEIEGARVKLFEHEFTEQDSAVHRALYHFVDGVLEIKSDKGSHNEGLLSLLRIHAELGKNAEVISAAALFEVYLSLKEKEPQKDAKSVANELLSRYPSSIFAKQLRMKGTE